MDRAEEQPGEDLRIEALSIKKAALILRSVIHTFRQKILSLMHEQGRMTVTQLFIQLRMEQSITSQHLAILRRARIVRAERDGKHIYYSINYDQLIHVQEVAKRLGALR